MYYISVNIKTQVSEIKDICLLLEYAKGIFFKSTKNMVSTQGKQWSSPTSDYLQNESSSCHKFPFGKNV